MARYALRISAHRAFFAEKSLYLPISREINIKLKTPFQFETESFFLIKNDAVKIKTEAKIKLPKR